MADNIQIRNIFHEDHNCNIDFFYTGKSNIIGLTHPDCSLLNAQNHSYIRIGLIEYEQSLLDTDEITINEEMTIVEELETKDSDIEALVNKVHIYGIVKGKNANTNTFRCVCTPILSDSGTVKILLTQESVMTEGVSTYGLGIWLKTQNYHKIYVSSDNSHSRESCPLNEEHLDSKYYISFLKNSEIESNVNTTNVYSQLSNKAICSSTNIYSSILRRLNSLESLSLPQIRYCYITYDEGFIPDYTENKAKLYQVIAPAAEQYSLTSSQKFTVFNSDKESISINEAGIYMIQLSSDIQCADSATKNADIELSLFIDDIRVVPCTMKKTITKDSKNLFSGNIAMVELTPSNKLYLKFKFGDNIGDAIVNNETCLSLTRIL
jgi:hypothetical protein